MSKNDPRYEGIAVQSVSVGKIELHDATITQDEHWQAFRKYVRRYTPQQYEQARKENATEDELEAKRAAERQRQADIIETERNSPLNQLQRVIKTRDIYPWQLEDFKKQNIQNAKALQAEFTELVQKRGVTLDQESIDYATNFLAQMVQEQKITEAKHGWSFKK